MEKEDLIKAVEQELQWLRYYANAETRKSFDPSKSPYEQLASIGYTKRVISLDMRCAFIRLTAETPINETHIDQMIISTDRKNHSINVYTALEVFMLKYPEEHDWVMNKLQ